MAPVSVQFLRALFLGVMAVTSSTCSSVPEIRGMTQGGMEFNGHLESMDDSSIFITGEDGQTIGVFLESIVSLDLLTMDTEDFLEEAGHCLGLMPHLSDSSLADLYNAITDSPDNWKMTYLWAYEIAKHAESKDLRLKATLLKLRAFLELGQMDQLSLELEGLKKSMHPMEAPPELCLLHAERSLLEEAHEQTLFWSTLPFLRIPAYWGPLRSRLKELRSISLSESIISYP